MSDSNNLEKLFFITNLEREKQLESVKKSLKVLALNKINNDQIIKSNNNGKGFSLYDKGYYKLNNNLNIYPSPEKKIRHKLKPVTFKTGLTKLNLKKKDNPEYYLPIMQKTKNIENSYSFLLENSNPSKSKDFSMKYQSIKLDDSTNKNESLDSKKEKKNDIKKIDKKNEIDKNEKNLVNSVVSYSFDKFGNSKLTNSFFNIDNYKKKHPEKKYEDILDQIDKKRKKFKEQILMRNKHQYVRNYNVRPLPLLNYDTLQYETNKLIDFQPTYNYLDIDDRELYAKDIISAKFPCLKLNGYDQLYMNLMTHVRPKQ